MRHPGSTCIILVGRSGAVTLNSCSGILAITSTLLLGAIVQPVIREAPRRFMSITSYLRGSGGGGVCLKVPRSFVPPYFARGSPFSVSHLLRTAVGSVHMIHGGRIRLR
jgi:hypothetical protein